MLASALHHWADSSGPVGPRAFRQAVNVLRKLAVLAFWRTTPRLFAFLRRKACPMSITYVKKAAASAAQATPAPAAPAPAALALQSVAELPTKAKPAPKPNKGHARKLAVSGLDLSTPQRVLLGHVLTLLKTSDSTLKRRIAAGDFPPPDGIFGRRPYWHSATVLPYFNSTKEGQQ